MLRRTQAADSGLSGKSYLVVTIRFSSSRTFPVTVFADSTVRDLKNEIATKQKASASGLRLILAGQSLKDDLKLSDFDIGNNSVLHALEVQPRANNAADSAEAGAENRAERGGDAIDVQYVKKQYYVYCKVCKSIQPGKLRVKCDTCGDGLFLLHRGPNGWEDVLTRRQISGQCQAPRCSGQYAKFYFRCGHHKSNSVDETAIPLNHIKPNSRLVECITCAEKSTLVLVFPCSSGHAMCLDCFQNYGVTRLNNKMFVSVENVGYSLPCPAGCENSFIQEIHHFHLLGDDQYERYHRFSAEQVLLSDGGVFCPRPGCGNGLMLNTESRQVVCQPPLGCGLVFCKHCLEEFHDGQCGMVPVQPTLTDDIAVDEESAQRSRWEAETRDMIARTTKPCPQCKAKTEHSGGCMHMTCPQCKFQWCWICAKDWNLDCQGSHWFG